MQHDVDYSVCGDDKKCKHVADGKLVKSLDAVPWNERQWGHWLARNTINTKQRVGLGTKKVKKKTTQNQSRLKKIMARGASRSVTQTYQTQFSEEKCDCSSC